MLARAGPGGGATEDHLCRNSKIDPGHAAPHGSGSPLISNGVRTSSIRSEAVSTRLNGGVATPPDGAPPPRGSTTGLLPDLTAPVVANGRPWASKTTTRSGAT